VRLSERGHEVTVYCCRPYCDPEPRVWRGVRRVMAPTLHRKGLEKLVHSLLSLLHVTGRGVDVVLVLGVAAAPFAFLPRLAGARVVLNTDGLEWRRKKWGRLASTYLRFAERAACATANHLVTDAHCVRDHYQAAYGASSTFIPYGSRPAPDGSADLVRALGVEPGRYLLYVSRFDPENNALVVRRAFEQVRTDLPLLMVGSAPYADAYVRDVRATRDPRVRFPGAIYGDGYLALQAHARAYVQASEVGGTHPALVEAIGLGGCVVANDVPEHREVLGDAGLYYDGGVDGLARRLQEVVERDDLVEECRARARAAAPRYAWDGIVTQYERLFAAVRDGVALPAGGVGC
jgi:glycosyltransferase involved in cell wall biosynthesis